MIDYYHYGLEILNIPNNYLEILNMGLSDKTSWKRWSVRELLCLGYMLRKRNEIESKGPVTTMEFSSISSENICDFENYSMSFEFEEVNTPRRPN